MRFWVTLVALLAIGAAWVVLVSHERVCVVTIEHGTICVKN